MQLNFINNQTQIKPVSFGCNNCNHHPISKTLPKDEFVKTADSPNKFKKSYEYAKNACMARLQEEDPFEYSVAIDKDGNILYENPGEKFHCTVLFDKLAPETTLIHGHPGEKLSPLSPGDITVFMAIPEIKTVVATDKNGNTCSMTKPDDFKNFKDPYLHKEIDELFMKTQLDYLGIPYETNEEYVKEYEKELGKRKGINDEEKLPQFIYGGERPENLREAIDMLKSQSLLYGLSFEEPYKKSFNEHIGEIKDGSDKQIEILKQFLKKVSEKYGTELEYSYI